MDGRVLKSCSCNHKIMENWRVSPCYYLKQLLHFICAQFLSSRMHWAVQVIIMFWIILFLKDFFKAASGAPSLENIRSTFFKATSEWMQKSIATFWPSFPPQRMRRPVIFWNRLPFKTFLTAVQSGIWQDYRNEGKIALRMTSLKTSWAISLSPFFVLRKFSIKCVADGCGMQKRCDKMAEFGFQLAISQHLWV